MPRQLHLNTTGCPAPTWCHVLQASQWLLLHYQGAQALVGPLLMVVVQGGWVWCHKC